MKTPAQDIILAPVITEASMAGIALKKYTFKVATNATKVDAISVRGRFRRQGAHAGYTASSKKAIVTLTKDSKGIDFFESMV